jgi:hypothetical protein
MLGKRHNEKGKPYCFCRKVLIASGCCFQQIEVQFEFDEDRHILEKDIIRGEFVEEKTEEKLTHSISINPNETSLGFIFVP